MKILLLDDQRLIARALGLTLSSMLPEAQVSICTNRNQAIALFDQQKDFELVFTDLNMPDVNGFEFMRDIKTRSVDTPVVFFSDDTSPNIASTAKLQGASGYISKSLASTEMLDALWTVVEGNPYFPDD